MINKFLTRIKIGATSRLVGVNASWILLNHLFQSAFLLILGIWTIRYLGPSDYGIISWALSFCILLSVFTFNGIENLTVKFLVQNPDEASNILGAYTQLRFFGVSFTLVLIILGGSVLSLDPKSKWVLYLIAASYLPSILKGIELDFQSRSKIKYNVFSQSAGFLSMVSLRTTMIIQSATIIGFSALYLIQEAFKLIALSAFNYKSGTRVLGWTASWKWTMQLIKQGWPLVISAFSVTAYTQLNIFILELLRGSEEVGIYSAAFRLIEVWNIVPSALAASALPILMKTSGNDEKDFDRRLSKCLRLGSNAAYLIIIPSLIFSHWIIVFLYGRQFEEAIAIFRTGILTLIPVFIGTLSNAYWIHYNLQRLMLIQLIAASAINANLNFLLVPLYGALGSAYSILLTQFTIVFIMPLLFADSRHIAAIRWSSLFKPSFSLNR